MGLLQNHCLCVGSGGKEREVYTQKKGAEVDQCYMITGRDRLSAESYNVYGMSKDS